MPLNFRIIGLNTAIIILGSVSSYSQATIVPYGSSWKYLDNGSDQGTSWRAISFDDALWTPGNAELGYGDGDEETELAYGPSSSNKYITTYFRKTFNITDPSAYSNFTLNLRRDDGCVVYINGVEAGRANIAAAPAVIDYTTLATSAVENIISSFSIASTAFNAGNNTIAVEIHQASINSTDISFNLQLLGNDLFGSTLTRGPYLQMGGQNSITIRWRTNPASNSRVEIGTSYGTYPTVFNDATTTTDHIVALTGLNPDTKYYYRIGNSTDIGAADAEKFFNTLPLANTTRKIRVAAFGDCGKNENSFQALTLARYTAYLSANNIDAPDAWLLMGDNAYEDGTDAEYTSNFFTAYGSSILKNHKVFPTPGNHEYANLSARQNDHAIPYYDIFTMPTSGQLGGVASGTEAYYSFNIGDIHFLALDAYGRENSGTTRMYDTTGAQALWVKADLAANNKKWTIAYWHHPPYTKGNHNSDTENDLINIRENFIRILERNGVDMIICGHSHDYERSYLLNGYYKSTPAGSALSEVDFNINTHTASQSSGKYNGTVNSCPYTYSSGKFRHGTVYVVAGSAGADGGVQLGYPHNAFPFSQDDGGMLYFEIDSSRLDAKFIRRDGVIADQFTIMKDVNRSTNHNTFIGAPVTLIASWSGNYSWTTTAATKSISVTPMAIGITNYSVTDDEGCLADQFTVNTSAALPVSLINYEVKEKADGNYISWQTASEINNKQFIIERSLDGINFETLTVVSASVNPSQQNKYSYTDAEPLYPDNYYKLVQEDIDGVRKQLGIKKITLRQKADLTLSMRAVSNNSLMLKIGSVSRSNLNLRIFDIQGKEYKRDVLYNMQGSSAIYVNLKPGIYICELKNDKGKKLVRKVRVP